MKIIFLIISILINYIPYTSALTFKSDGTVIKSDGTYLKEPPFLQYQRALNSYLNGEPLPEDWPVVELDSNGNPKKVKGYFGEKILEEGAPLFSVPKNLGGDVMESLALQNGLLKDQLGAVLVSNSKSEWRQESEIEEEIYNQSKQYSTYLANSDFMGFKLQEITKTIINYENLKKESQQFLLLNPDDDIAVNEYRRELESKVADISDKLNTYFGYEKEESKNLLNELSGKLKELNKDYKNNEIVNILQLELKNNIEQKTDMYIDDLNYSINQVDQLIDDKEALEIKSPNIVYTDLTKMVKTSRVIDFAKNIEVYKKLFDQFGADKSPLVSEDYIMAIRSWEEYPGAVFNRFNTIAALQEDSADFNEISEEFRKSVENAITVGGIYSLEEGLQRIKMQNIQNKFGAILELERNGKDFDQNLKDQVQNEFRAIEQELVLNQNDELLDCNNNSPSDVEDYGVGC